MASRYCAILDNSPSCAVLYLLGRHTTGCGRVGRCETSDARCSRSFYRQGEGCGYRRISSAAASSPVLDAGQCPWHE